MQIAVDRSTPKTPGNATRTCVFDDRLAQMAKELAARIDATNPQLRAGGGAPQKGISGGAGTHLWTGGVDYKAAQAAARRAAEAEGQDGNQDAASVEMTIAGELLDSINFSGNGIDYAPEKEELVKQREDRVTTSYQLERSRANAWDKALAWEPTFAVAGSVKHRAALLDARRAAASPR